MHCQSFKKPKQNRTSAEKFHLLLKKKGGMNDGIRPFSLLFFIVALCCTVSCSRVIINNVEDFLTLSSEAPNLGNIDEIVFETDLDLRGQHLFPLGVDASGTCTPFQGVLDGQGHVIRNLVMDQKSNSTYCFAGLFCQMTGATVKNLVIDSSCSFSGDSVGVLSMYVSGKLDLVNVTNYANISSILLAGGLVGNISNIENTAVTIENCSNFGSITGPARLVGGLVAFIDSSQHSNISIRGSRNHGPVVSESDDSVHAGGFLGWVHGTNSVNISFTDCENRADLNVSSNGARVGGFLGWAGWNDDFALALTRCTNGGNIQSHTGGV